MDFDTFNDYYGKNPHLIDVLNRLLSEKEKMKKGQEQAKMIGALTERVADTINMDLSQEN